MKISVFPLGPLQSNMYVLANGDGAILIDPSVSKRKIKAVAPDFDISTIKAVFITHAHFDHILYSDIWYEELEAEDKQIPFFLSPKDYCALSDPKINCSGDMRSDMAYSFTPTSALEANGKLFLNDLLCTVYETPGHTPGSVCYCFSSALDNKKYLFSGDMLFYGSVGRADLPGGSSQEMQESIDLLKSIDVNMEVFPGHGPKTTLFAEQRKNPYFN